MESLQIDKFKKEETIGEIPNVSDSSYIYLRENNLTSATPKRRRKPKSEKLRNRYKTQSKIVSLLHELGEKKMAESMGNCCQRSYALTCGVHIISERFNHYCNIRFCSLCANRRASRYKNKYVPYALAFVEERRLTPCLLTLTQKKIKGEKLIDSRERLVKSFRKLIRREFFDDYFAGGIFTVENTNSEAGNHTHLHIVIFRKKFISHRLLKEHWAAVSPGAENLNIKLIHDLEKGLSHCIKYVSKPQDLNTLQKEGLLEILEIRGKRMIDTFGDFRQFCRQTRLPKQVKEERPRAVEGQCCTKCDDGESLLFQISMTAQERIRLYEQIELAQRAAPFINYRRITRRL
jgi:hypothetical protein